MANLHPKQRFFVATVPFDEGERISKGKEYEVQAGIEFGDPEEGKIPDDLEMLLLSTTSYLISITAQGHDILGGENGWCKELSVDPNGPQRQVIDFQLKAIKPGDSKVNCDLYFNNRWLRRLAFDLQVADSA